MIFRQLFESISSTYTYLLGSRPGGEALIIDPVLEKVDWYLQLLSELDLTLVKAVEGLESAGGGQCQLGIHCRIGCKVDSVMIGFDKFDQLVNEAGLTLVVDAVVLYEHAALSMTTTSALHDMLLNRPRDWRRVDLGWRKLLAVSGAELGGWKLFLDYPYQDEDTDGRRHRS